MAWATINTGCKLRGDYRGYPEKKKNWGAKKGWG